MKLKKQAQTYGIIAGAFTLLAGFGIGYLIALFGKRIPAGVEEMIVYVQYAIYALGALNIVFGIFADKGFARAFLNIFGIISIITGINFISGILNVVAASKAKKYVLAQKEESVATSEDDE